MLSAEENLKFRHQGVIIRCIIECNLSDLESSMILGLLSGISEGVKLTYFV
jgi:hypothetical protein